MVQATAKGKRQRPQQRRKQAAVEQAAVEQAASPWRLSAWQWSCLFLLFSAAFLRLFELTAKVLHHDEGVNGNFLSNLFRNGYYHYDPANYHGPTLYYAGLVTTTINAFFYGKAGLSTFAIRLVTVIFGVGVIWLLLCLRRQLGTFGTIAAAALACVSPGFVFFSRYFIHEILFIFFTLAVVVAVLYYNETREPKYLMLGSASLALMGATKETWIITLVVWLLAMLCASIYLKFRGTAPPQASSVRGVQSNGDSQVQGSKRWLYANAALLFAVIWICLYSSFFTNFPQGLYDSFLTYTYWFKTSGNANVYDWTKYFTWLGKSELPALALGGLGIVIALLKASSRFAVFTAFWSLGILSAYCLIPYKTPWLALSIVLPFIIMAGYGLELIFKARSVSLRGIALTTLALAVVFSTYQAIQLSFFRYDDDTEPYSYAHSKRDLLNLVREINTIAAGNPAGKNIGITVMSSEHWPLPWYLRDYPNAGYWGKVVDTHEPIVIAHENQVAEVEQKLGDKYRLYSSHDLRPGVRLYLFLRNDVQP